MRAGCGQAGALPRSAQKLLLPVGISPPVLSSRCEADSAPGALPRRCAGQKLRCVGSGLSPNGLAFCEDGMVSLALLDRIVSLDSDKQQVTVQAGARVEEVRGGREQS